MSKCLYFVIPCYNEEDCVGETNNRLMAKLKELYNQALIDEGSKIVYVNDGSSDRTWDTIYRLHTEERNVVVGINLSKNEGHQNALFAGLMYSKNYADMVISMDADLQDDIDVVNEMVENFYLGCDVVYGVRSERETDTFFKKITAETYYKIMNRIGGNLIYNHADYRLLSKRALESLADFTEVNLFLRGIIPMLGYKSGIVYYQRAKRFAGKSKYPFRKMLLFAIEGITSLTTRPIQFITKLGLFVFIVSVVMLLYSILEHVRGNTILGWTSVMTSIWAVGGLILLSIGIIGEYIGKIYLETKRRPRYIVEKIVDD